MRWSVDRPGRCRYSRELLVVSRWIERRTRAGLPATMVPAGTSCVTTLPAPTMARFSDGHVRQDRGAGSDRRAFLHERASRPSSRRRSAARRSRSWLVGYESLMNITPWPMNT